MPKLMPMVRLLDNCVLDDRCRCTRCGTEWGEPIPEGQHAQCSAGARELLGYMFWCPACEQAHPYYVKADAQPNGAHWSFNGDFERPTFAPSLLVREGPCSVRCHLHVVDGQIRYCDDCGHTLKGRVVEMVDFP